MKIKVANQGFELLSFGVCTRRCEMSGYTMLNSVKIVGIEVQELAIENCVVP